MTLSANSLVAIIAVSIAVGVCTEAFVEFKTREVQPETSIHLVTGWVTSVSGNDSQIIMSDTRPVGKERVVMSPTYHYFVTPKPQPLLVVGKRVTVAVQCAGKTLPSANDTYVCGIKDVTE